MDWKYLKNPFVVITDTAGNTTDLISQHVIMMKESEKILQIAETSLLDELGVKTAIYLYIYIYINMFASLLCCHLGCHVRKSCVLELTRVQISKTLRFI